MLVHLIRTASATIGTAASAVFPSFLQSETTDSMNGQGTEGHGSGGKATGATVFIGAGGGGDTVFATCCALVQSKSQTHRGPCIALGVGYGSSEYEKALGNGLKNRKTGEWDRLPCDKAKLREYLSKVVQPIQGAKGPLKDVWRVVGMSQEELMEFAKPLIPEGKDPGWSKNASFKYMTLMEETTFANQLAVRGEKQEICMVFSTAKSTDSEDYVRMENALRDFLKSLNLAQIVVLDVGGDIIAPKVQRDSNVLRACIAIAEELKVRLVVEIFGAGCDAHAPYVLVEERLARGGYTPNADKVSTTELRDFLPFLKAEEHKLASEIMGEGRACGNFMLANSLLKEVVDGKSTLDAAHAKMLAALHKRPDYSQGTDEFRKELDEGNVKGDKRKMLAALGQVYVFEVVDKHGKKQANFWSSL